MKYERTMEAERAKAESRSGRLLSEVFGGRHHVQWPSFKLEAIGQASYTFIGDCSTWDFNTLTRLVVAAHAHAVRVEIINGGPRRLKLWLSPREREGPMHVMHPTLAQALSRMGSDPSRDELQRRPPDHPTSAAVGGKED